MEVNHFYTKVDFENVPTQSGLSPIIVICGRISLVVIISNIEAPTSCRRQHWSRM